MRASETEQATPAGEEAYGDLQAFCLFIGYPKSGHSLVGAMLDAHPDVVIARAMNPLALIAVDGVPRDEVFDRLVESSREEAARGRKQNKYRYGVEGQWQGRTRTLRVLGDKFSDRTTKRIGKSPDALPAFAREVGVPLRLIHVVRNPFDMVARIAKSKLREGSAEERRERATAYIDRLAGLNDEVIRSGGHPVLTVRHESLVESPHSELARMCEFLGVEAEQGYLDACAAIVFRSPQRTRDLLEWGPEQIAAVDGVIARRAFFDGYTFAG
jgi:sulfotransferase family protein